MLDKITQLPDKTLLIIGLTLQLIAILFAVVLGFIFEISIDGWKNFVFNILFFTGVPFIILACDKKRKNKNNIGKQ